MSSPGKRSLISWLCIDSARRRKEAMVGFRNVAVHEYTRLNLEVVHSIITKQLAISVHSRRPS
ncbi:MAG: DUF86 domain-containing protein [Nitrospira sp.]|nr:DUF86 domain-containing protein [Nitrospira sp.]